MKRVYLAIGLCAALLIFEAWVFLPSTTAKTDVIPGLLQVPAPPPPNPLIPRRNSSSRPTEFFNLSKPPGDNASIDDLVEYWSAIQRSRQTLTYAPEPTDATLDRLFKAVDSDPAKLPKLIGSFPDGERSADFVKRIYDHEGTTGVFSKDDRKSIRDWLVYHSPAFSDDLYRLAEKAGDTDTYVTNQDELLALTRVDFDKAKPLIDRLYSNPPDKVSRVLAKWALYRHALDTDSTGDIDRYRDELKSVVEDKSLPGPMRDLAMDALVSEKEWSGRDDWYTSLLTDETLGDLGTYTGLTTLINVSPEEKYTEKMLELLKSDNKTVRTAAVRNLLLKGNGSKLEVVKAMLPWLEDPTWANDISNAREGIVQALHSVKIPESVPGLIKMLDEKKKQLTVGSPAVAMANAASRIANAANSMASASNTIANKPANSMRMNSTIANKSFAGTSEVFAYRSAAIGALAFQADPAAGPALRRLMTEMEGYERYSLIEALVKCNGFTVSEQVDAFEAAATRQKRNEERAANTTTPGLSALGNGANYASNVYSYADNSPMYKAGPLTASDVRQLIGERLLTTSEVSDELIFAAITRIESLDSRDAKVAQVMRNAMLRWPNLSVNLLFLHDIRNDRADVASVVRLLAMRRPLKAQYSSEVFDTRNASPTANGIVSCMIEDTADYDAILDGDNAEAKAALLACARLIRAPLPVAKVAEYVKSADRRLALAAERYLESEDSQAARAVVLSLHPGEAKILGATTAFFVGSESTDSSDGGLYREPLFASVDPNEPAIEAPVPVYDGDSEGNYEGEMGLQPATEDLPKTEKMLQDEVKRDADLLGIYAYARQYVRIYKDRVIFSWDDDDSRYHERPLNAEEFDLIKGYLTDNHVDDLKPFLQCDTDPCTEHELLMLGRGGGRRVYTDGGNYEFFRGLESIFAQYRAGNAVIKYALSREIPNLEILLADENVDVQTVWKAGSDMRAAVTDKAARKRVDQDIDAAVEKAEEKDDEMAEGAEMTPSQALRIALTKKHEYDGISWRSVVKENDAGVAAQPPGFDLIPMHGQSTVPASQEQWKSRAGGLEIRASEDGVFKIAGGKTTVVAKGSYSDPVITPNGKWAVLHRTPTGDEGESSLARINLLTGREYQIKVDNYRDFLPKAYIATINKVLVVENTAAYYEGRRIGEQYDIPSDVANPDPDPSSMMLLDPETGILQDIAGEMGPLSQQTFRPLQASGKSNEFWAAIPDAENKATRVGLFNTNNFGFKQLMLIPKITFNSMSMWADEPGGKLYFIYRGHLLSLPLKK
ncbi:MAG: hypothetical protein ABJA02_13275 [Acidobacteriota bacterium]